MQPVGLRPHPEGGLFREVFRSGEIVTTATGTRRSALTHIYFRLEGGGVSRFHRVSSDEIWNLYEGEGVRLLRIDPGSSAVQSTALCRSRRSFCHVIPAGTWQAAEAVDGPVLVGCSVGPGFDFEDFELLRAGSELGQRLVRTDPAMARFLAPDRSGGG